jgi:diguanylate cyclase (GGDEF)-like protein
VTRVLVVDDAQVMRRAVEKMLQSDYDIVLANDGEAGWETLVRDEQIEMLITDIQMPLLDGYGLICRVRADGSPRIRELPIITITGAEDDETRIRAYACGSTDFLIKPFDKKLLQSRVHAYLRLKRASLLHAGAAAGAPAVDPLTRLNGLAGFVAASRDLHQHARQAGTDLSVVALDIDGFPALQRDHGAAVTDALLKRTAALLQGSVRAGDVVARVGDSEFALLLPRLGRDEAMALCERLRERIAAEPVTTPAGPVAVTASFGLASLLADAPESCEKCLALVEQRLSQARSDGGNRIGITLLSDVMPAAEEVVLAAVPEQPAADDVGGEVVLDLSDDSSQLSVSELEALVRDETARHKRGTSSPRS